MQEFASADEADISGDMEAEVQLPSQQRAAASLQTGSADGVQQHRASAAGAAGSVRKAALPGHDSNVLFQGSTAEVGSAEGAGNVGHVGSASTRQHHATATQPSHIVPATTAEAEPSALFGAAAANDMTSGAAIASAWQAAGMQAGQHGGASERSTTHVGSSSRGGGGIMQRVAAAPDAVRGALFGRTGSAGGDGARGGGFAAVTSVESSGQGRAVMHGCSVTGRAFVDACPREQRSCRT